MLKGLCHSLVGTNRNVEHIPTLKIAVNTKPTARRLSWRLEALCVAHCFWTFVDCFVYIKIWLENTTVQNMTSKTIKLRQYQEDGRILKYFINKRNSQNQIWNIDIFLEDSLPQLFVCDLRVNWENKLLFNNISRVLT